MLYCYSCGGSFPESWVEFEEGDRSVGLRDTMVCPFCRSDDIEDAAYCKSCDEWVAEDEMEDGLCKKCRSDALTKLRQVITSKLFSPAQSDWILSGYGEV